MTIVQEVVFKSFGRQKEFVTSTALETLAYGGYGSGKTIALAYKTMIRACRPGAREGLCRKHLVTLKATTLKTLLDGDGATPPVLPRGTYTHNKADKTIKIRQGGEIVYFGMDEDDKLGSLNLTGCGIDQAEELSEDNWFTIAGRTRVKVQGLTNQRYAVCNPKGPNHHLAQRFATDGSGIVKDSCTFEVVEQLKGAPVRLTRHQIRMPSTDNPHLTPEYLAYLSSFTGMRKARYVDGIWAGSEGMVYDSFDRDAHVRPHAVSLGAYSADGCSVVCSVDDGTAKPFCCLRGLVDPDGRLHVVAEKYQSNLAPHEKLAAIKVLGFGADTIAVDPSAAAIVKDCQRSGLHATGADNTVLTGIAAVQDRIAKGKLFIDPICEHLVREMESYEWAKDKNGLRDRPVKENDHAVDALRYMVVTLDGGLGAPVPAMVARFVGEPVAFPEPVHVDFAKLREDPDWGFDG